jgi:hypothetical protein
MQIKKYLRNFNMDEYTADTFANRDEPIPLFTVTGSDDDSASDSEKTSKHGRLRKSASRMRAMAQDIGAEQAQRLQNNGTSSIHDRLFAKYILSTGRYDTGCLHQRTGFCSKSYRLKKSTVVQKYPSTPDPPNLSKGQRSVYR